MLEDLSDFVARASYRDLSDAARAALRVRVLDALGCALGARDGAPVRAVREHVAALAHDGRCTLVGGGHSSPELAALYNGALVRYLDFNDSYLAKRETCHPSDNLGAVMAAAEFAGRSGADLLAALAVAYQVQCRLSDEAPVRDRGFDHTTQGSIAAAAGVAHALGLTREQTANAIAISATALNALRVTRTGGLSNWKGLAYPHTGFGATHAALLAMRGITGPAEVFEGNKGFMETISGRFTLDWSREDLERVTRTIVKRYNAEIHSQATLEAVLELRAAGGIEPGRIAHVTVETFDVAHRIIGGGEEGDKTIVRTKEEADHSLPYLVAVALLDGQVMPEQYRPERIVRSDVQALLRRVTIEPVEALSRRFPDEMPCRVTITLDDGRTFTREKRDYEGFTTRPAGWAGAVRKFHALAAAQADEELRAAVIDAVARLDAIRVEELTWLLARAGAESAQAAPARRGEGS